MEYNAVLLDKDDDVATLTRDLESGDKIKVSGAGKEIELIAGEDIEFGHKVALRDISEGEEIRKYGEIIGRSNHSIKKGRHVHVHNLESLRMIEDD